MNTECISLPSGPSLNNNWILSASTSQLDLEIKLVSHYLSQLVSSRNHRNRFLALAPELLGLILDALSDPASLCACSLACRHLLPFAQTRLFASSPLYVVSPRTAARATQLARRRPDLAAVVRTLKLADIPDLQPDADSEDYDDVNLWSQCMTESIDLCVVFASLSRVRGLRFEHAASNIALLDTVAGESLLRMFSQIKDLVLSDCSFDSEAEPLPAFVGRFSCLESLSMEAVDWYEPSADLGPSLTLRSLALDLDSSKMLPYIYKCLQPGSLEKLCFSLMGQHGRPAWRDVFSCIGGSLRTIEVEHYLAGSFDWFIAELRAHCPNARHLRIQMKGTMSQSKDIDPIIGLLKTTQLQFLSVVFHSDDLSDHDPSDPFDFQLDDVLSAAGLLQHLAALDKAEIIVRTTVPCMIVLQGNLEDRGCYPVSERSWDRADIAWEYSTVEGVYDISSLVLSSPAREVTFSLRYERKVCKLYTLGSSDDEPCTAHINFTFGRAEASPMTGLSPTDTE